MPLVRVAALAALTPGTLTEVVAGEERYAVCNVDGEVFAIEGICPHSGGPLGQGALHGDIVVCPWHAWEYDCRSGVCVHEDELKLETFAVKIEGGDVFIDVP